MLLVLRVAVPMALFDVVADSFENVGLIQVAKLYAMRLALYCDLAAVEVDRTTLCVEAFCGEFVHGGWKVLRCDSVSRARATCGVFVLCVGRECLSPSLDSYSTASTP